MSPTATTSMSLPKRPWVYSARNTSRPMRPKPLIAMRVAMVVHSLLRRGSRRLAGIWRASITQSQETLAANPGEFGSKTARARSRLVRMSAGDSPPAAPVLAAQAVKAAARACQFPLVGLAPAAALDGGPLRQWLAAGHAAGMSWMGSRLEDRLDPRRVLNGARTVMALGIPYGRTVEPGGQARSPVARYARGRDYHYA